jgi:hypothetical protein
MSRSDYRLTKEESASYTDKLLGIAAHGKAVEAREAAAVVDDRVSQLSSYVDTLERRLQAVVWFLENNLQADLSELLSCVEDLSIDEYDEFNIDEYYGK